MANFIYTLLSTLSSMKGLPAFTTDDEQPFSLLFTIWDDNHNILPARRPSHHVTRQAPDLFVLDDDTSTAQLPDIETLLMNANNLWSTITNLYTFEEKPIIETLYRGFLADVDRVQRYLNECLRIMETPEFQKEFPEAKVTAGLCAEFYYVLNILYIFSLFLWQSRGASDLQKKVFAASFKKICVALLKLSEVETSTRQSAHDLPIGFITLHTFNAGQVFAWLVEELASINAAEHKTNLQNRIYISLGEIIDFYKDTEYAPHHRQTQLMDAFSQLEDLIFESLLIAYWKKNYCDAQNIRISVQENALYELLKGQLELRLNEFANDVQRRNFIDKFQAGLAPIAEQIFARVPATSNTRMILKHVKFIKEECARTAGYLSSDLLAESLQGDGEPTRPGSENDTFLNRKQAAKLLDLPVHKISYMVKTKVLKQYPQKGQKCYSKAALLELKKQISYSKTG